MSAGCPIRRRVRTTSRLLFWQACLHLSIASWVHDQANCAETRLGALRVAPARPHGADPVCISAQIVRWAVLKEHSPRHWQGSNLTAQSFLAPLPFPLAFGACPLVTFVIDWRVRTASWPFLRCSCAFFSVKRLSGAMLPKPQPLAAPLSIFVALPMACSSSARADVTTSSASGGKTTFRDTALLMASSTFVTSFCNAGKCFPAAATAVASNFCLFLAASLAVFAASLSCAFSSGVLRFLPPRGAGSGAARGKSKLTGWAPVPADEAEAAVAARCRHSFSMRTMRSSVSFAMNSVDFFVISTL